MNRLRYETIPTRTGVRMVQHGTVLSEVRSSPGPTHSVVDVIAAVVKAVAPGRRVAMLGFAGGGVLAPLRGMDGRQSVDAVDLDDSGWKVFQQLCSAWAGDVHFECVEACAWLRGTTSCYETIIEDLSVVMDSDVFKPAVTWSELPDLIQRKLVPGGVTIHNLLRPDEFSWQTGMGRILREGRDARVIGFRDYENRILISGAELPTARKLGFEVRGNLRKIRSRLASQIAVQSFTR